MGITAKLRLVFLKLNLGLKGRLSLNILREVCDYLADFPYLPYLSRDGQRLLVLSFATMRIQTYADAAIMKHSLCLIDPAKVFCLLGQSALLIPALSSSLPLKKPHFVVCRRVDCTRV